MGLFIRLASFPENDLGLISRQTYAGTIYRGDAAGYRVRVYSGNAPVVGFAGYCRSGIATFEQCGMTVTSLSGTLCDTSGCTSGLVVYTGAGLSQWGDSGAPFFAVSPDPAFNGAFIRGSHVGMAGSAMYAENYGVIRDFVGLSVITS